MKMTMIKLMKVLVEIVCRMSIYTLIWALADIKIINWAIIIVFIGTTLWTLMPLIDYYSDLYAEKKLLNKA